MSVYITFIYYIKKIIQMNKYFFMKKSKSLNKQKTN